MPPVKPLDRTSQKWARVAQGSEQSYKEGIENPRTDWATATKNAEAQYTSGVQAAIGAKRFGKGVTKAGTGKWQQNALNKGPSRWSEGIRLSTDAYAAGFEPYRRVIESTTLPPRGPKGDPKNIQRVAVMADALHKAKLSQTGG